MKSKYESFNKEFFQKLIAESTSISEILVKLGLRPSGYNHTKLSKFLKSSDYDLTSLKGRHINRRKGKSIKKKDLSKLLCKNSTGNSNRLKKRLIEYGVKKYICENPDCGISEWHGKSIDLELHHINGDHFDNRLENLVLLCPNCHSQTSNFRGRNSKEKNLNEVLSEIAILEAKNAIENLIKFEEKNKYEKEEIKSREKKVLRFCKQCGKEIKSKKAKYFCCIDCANEYQRSNQKYTIDDIVEAAKACSNFCELGRCFSITDAGVKKRLKNAGKINEVRNLLNNNKKKYSVVQFSIDGDFIKKWDSANDAAKKLSLERRYIYKCCRGVQNTYGGFMWKFADE